MALEPSMTKPAPRLEFRDDFGVFVCEHVFKSARSVLFCVRDWDGSWQFLCGEDDPRNDPIHLIHVGELLARDPSLHETAGMDVGSFGERTSASGAWDFGALEPGGKPT
jgi:hypothetical protein